MNPKFRIIAIYAVALILIISVGFLLFKTQNKSPVSKVNEHPSEDLDAMVGKQFPHVTLYDKSGTPFSVSVLKGKNVILFFNEGIMCYPACWDQISALATDPRFNNSDTMAISVVTDRPQDWASAAQKSPDIAKAMFLYDQNGDASRQLGLLSLPSSMHAGVMPGHTYIVLDKEGVVRYVFDDPHMGNNNQLLADKIKSF